MRTRVAFLLALFWSVGAAEAAEPMPSSKVPAPKLTSPASAEAVEATLASVAEAEAPVIVTATRRLAAAGGAAAAEGLRGFLRHRDETVRTAALEGLTRIGLRSDKFIRHARRVLAEGANTSRSERVAALALLGAIGDGRDMPHLLDFAAAGVEDKTLRTAAFRAMAELTGAKLPYVHARWTYWWRTQAKRRTALLERAVEALQDEPTAETADLFRDVVEHNALFDLPYTVAILERWLRGGNAQLIAVACQVAGALRAVDLADLLLSQTRRRTAEAITGPARVALGQLGYVAPKERD